MFNSEMISEEPLNELAARLPCFAIGIPTDDNNIATVVDIFNVFNPSPPVPHVSKELGYCFILLEFLKINFLRDKSISLLFINLFS